MVIGDSKVVGDLICGIIERDPHIQVAAKPADGDEAVSKFRRTEAEAVVINIGGHPKESLATISRLLRIDAKARIIMVSTLNFTNVKTGLEVLVRGAVEFLQTPAIHTSGSSLAVFQHNLTETVFELGLARRKDWRTAGQEGFRHRRRGSHSTAPGLRRDPPRFAHCQFHQRPQGVAYGIRKSVLLPDLSLNQAGPPSQKPGSLFSSDPAEHPKASNGVASMARWPCRPGNRRPTALGH